MALEFERLGKLVELALSGDESVFFDIYEISYPVLYKQVHSILGSDADTQDVLQDVYIRIWSNLHQIEDAQFFILWAKRIAVNTSITALNRRQDIPTDDVVAQLEQSIDPQADPLSTYMDMEWSANLLDLISQLDVGIGQTIYLRYYEGLKIKEIADQLDVAEGTVKSRIHSGKRQLQKLIEKDKRFHGVLLGGGLVTALLQENASKGVAYAKEGGAIQAGSKTVATGRVGTTARELGTHIGKGMVLATATGLGIIALTSTAKVDVVPETIPSQDDVVRVVDTFYPSLELVEYKDKSLSILVSDEGLGIDYDRLYCVLEDGQMIAPTAYDESTGAVTFITDGGELDIHVWDKAGNETYGHLGL